MPELAPVTTATLPAKPAVVAHGQEYKGCCGADPARTRLSPGHSAQRSAGRAERNRGFRWTARDTGRRSAISGREIGKRFAKEAGSHARGPDDDVFSLAEIAAAARRRRRRGRSTWRPAAPCHAVAAGRRDARATPLVARGGGASLAAAGAGRSDGGRASPGGRRRASPARPSGRARGSSRPACTGWSRSTHRRRGQPRLGRRRRRAARRSGLPRAHAARLPRAARPGGGGGGGGGLRQKLPAPKVQREGDHAMSSPLPARSPCRQPAPNRANRREPLEAATIVAPIASAPADARDTPGVLREAPPGRRPPRARATAAAPAPDRASGLDEGSGSGIGDGRAAAWAAAPTGPAAASNRRGC